MRKTDKPVIKLISLILVFQIYFTSFASADTLYPPDLTYQPPEQSREEVYYREY